ncbi:MAG: DUF1836 domain-containing protein [Clostridia bacterium]|nr:DUF1836 domain-containing protein [Clostridia bacterium]
MITPDIRQRLKASITDFRLPRYHEIPDVGLYLEQVTQYINGILVPVGCAEITTSMISNYVKKGVIPPPQKKQYRADQIIYLIFIAITKNVLHLESIVRMFDMRRELYTLQMAYDYFCNELENMLAYVFGHKDHPEENLGVTQTEEKALLRNVIISVSHSMYISAYFSEIKHKSKPESGAFASHT